VKYRIACAFDPVGNVTNRLISGLQGFTDTIQTRYQYDVMNRLANDGPAWAQTYRVRLEVDDIGSAQKLWSANNPDGRRVAIGSELTATLYYIHLPTNNSDFVEKGVTDSRLRSRHEDSPGPPCRLPGGGRMQTGQAGRLDRTSSSPSWLTESPARPTSRPADPIFVVCLVQSLVWFRPRRRGPAGRRASCPPPQPSRSVLECGSPLPLLTSSVTHWDL